jgi:hypothetical protein
MRWLPSLLAAALAACSPPPGPPPGSEVRMEMVRMVSGAELEREDSGLNALIDAYFSPAAVERRHATNLALYAAEGRVALARCALGDHSLLFRTAVLPTGIVPERGELMRVRLGDSSTPDQGLGIVTEPPELEHGSIVRRYGTDAGPAPSFPVPAEARPAPAVLAQYHPVTGGWLIRCVAP